MATLDLVFEGGGAKGMVFVGALQSLLEKHNHTPGRLLGTSAGAITAALLAAGYTVSEMLAALEERDNGQPVFQTFLGKPKPFEREAIRNSSIRQFLKDVNLKFVPDFLEDRMDDEMAERLAEHPKYQNLYAFVERGGWFSADAFIHWMRRKLDEGQFKGEPRNFGGMTLSQFHKATGAEMSLVVADTTANRMRILNHNTAPDCPVVWAVRMSMSIPLLWEEVTWQQEWGEYRGKEMKGNIMVDGGMLSNFPISLFLAPDPGVIDIMGEPKSDYVLGLLIDDYAKVIVPAERGLIEYGGQIGDLMTVQRIRRLVNTMMTARDNAAIEFFHEHVVRLPAGGYGVTEFDMSETRRKALVEAGRTAMEKYLAANPNRFQRTRDLEETPSKTKAEVASSLAKDILSQP